MHPEASRWIAVSGTHANRGQWQLALDALRCASARCFDAQDWTACEEIRGEQLVIYREARARGIEIE